MRSDVGQRLKQVRASRTQPEMAAALELAHRTYAGYERGEAEIGAGPLGILAAEGWNANWILTGEGPERLQAWKVGEDGGAYLSQELSDEAITIALEITDDIIASQGARYVPRALYARLFRLMLQGITQGLPVADVHDVGHSALRDLVSGRPTEGAHDSEQAVGGAGTGGRR